MIHFIRILGSMSLQATLIILVVLIFRKLFEKIYISKKYMMLLWAIPFFLLICPWKISVPFGFWEKAPADYGVEAEALGENALGTGTWRNEDVIGSAKNGATDSPTAGGALSDGNGDTWMGANDTSGEMLYGISGETSSGMNSETVEGWSGMNDMTEEGLLEMLVGTDKAWSDGKGESEEVLTVEEAGKGENNISGRRTWLEKTEYICFFIWLVGVSAIFLHTLLSYSRLQERLLCSVCQQDNIYLADDIPVPMVFGLFRPRIYLPSGLEESYLPYVVAHEQTHIRRRDPLWKLVVFIITSIHWFNPLVWLAYFLLGKDIEMACDEETVQRLGMEKRRDYANALLQLSAGKGRRSYILSTPVAFDEGDTRSRIQNILKYRKTLQIVAVIVVVAGILMGFLLLTKTGDTVPQGNIDTMTEVAADIIFIPEGMVDEVVLTYTTGNVTESVTFKGEESDKICNWLKELLVEKEPISQSRSEDRAKEITFQMGEQLQYHFNEKMNEIWMEDGVKPSFSYEVADAEGAKTFLKNMLANVQNPLSENMETSTSNLPTPSLTMPSETEVFALRRQVTAGMTKEEIARITENIKVANQTLEKAYLNEDIFEELSDPESLYWNYFDATGDIQIGWKLKPDSPTYNTGFQMTYDEFLETYGEPVMAYNRFDADNFIELMEEMRDSMKSELAKRDFTMLIHNVRVAKDSRNVDCLKEAYYILHDLDYFLFRYGPTDVGPYVKDGGTISKFYGVLNAYDMWRAQYLYTDLDVDFSTMETVWTELRQVEDKLMHIVKVQMANGEEVETLYAVRNQEMGDEIAIAARILNQENRHNLVVFITDSTSNYGSTDIHVLHLEAGNEGLRLVEDLTILDGNENAPEYESYKDTCLLTDVNNMFSFSGDNIFLSMVGWKSALRIRGLQDEQEVFHFVFWDGTQWICDSFQGTSVDQGEEITVDLNGDGREEKVRYECRYASVGSRYVEAELLINGEDYIQTVEDALVSLESCTTQQVANYRIVDIDSTDSYKEILIADAGPSGDPAITFFRFTGEELFCLGTVGTLSDPDSYLIPGDGTIVAKNRVYWPENNGVEEIYFLEGDKLQKHENYTYKLTYEREHKLLQDLPVYHLGDLENVAAVLKAGEDTITFTRIYEDGWILLRTGEREEYAIQLTGGHENRPGNQLPDGRYIDEVVADMSRAG